MAKHLYFICGLPDQTATPVCRELEKKLPKLDFYAVSAQRRSPKYTERYLNTVSRVLADYLIKRKEDLPETISLLIVDDIDVDVLYKHFFPFIRILKCCINDVYNIDNCVRVFENVIKKESPIEKSSAIFLPIYNFRTEGEEAERLFMDFYSGKKTIQELQVFFPQKKFNSENLPGVLHAKQRKNFHIDSRGLVFPPCKPDEAHGDVQELAEEDPHVNHSLLAAFYRFGVLKGSGFHYDVQHPNGKNINDTFYCKKTNRSIPCNNRKYVNIYLNDFIRIS